MRKLNLQLAGYALVIGVIWTLVAVARGRVLLAVFGIPMAFFAMGVFSVILRMMPSSVAVADTYVSRGSGGGRGGPWSFDQIADWRPDTIDDGPAQFDVVWLELTDGNVKCIGLPEKPEDRDAMLARLEKTLGPATSDE